MIISVSGIISSGKTTLAKKISDLYNFVYIPQKRNALNFLDDFFQNIPENFFATQTSFLINKITEIYEKCRSNNIVVDRSLFEDINIFARLWMDNYAIDGKEKELYKDLADYLITTIPPTDIFILCKCEKETLLERFQERKKRSFENKYPKDYLQQLWDKYETIHFPENAVVVEVDTKHLDVRKDESVINIMSSILHYANAEKHKQLSLFDNDVDFIESYKTANPYIKLVNNPSNLFFSDNIFKIEKKKIYLAAPFTEFATVEPKLEHEHNNEILIGIETNRAYNILPEKYQRLLRKIKKLLSFNGEFDVILPHKDENNWGKTYITNNQIVDSMINNVKKIDLLVAVISNSVGVHMELAMTHIQNKPMLLIIVDELTSGFYAEGFRFKNNVLVLHVQSIEKVYDALNNSRVTEFIRRTLKNEKMDRE